MQVIAQCAEVGVVMVPTLEAKTYLPSEPASLEALHVGLGRTVGGQYALVGPGGRVVIPSEVHDILVQVVEAMREGKAVTVTPNERTLTTQETADLLGVSRPTVVKLIESGILPAQRLSTRRTLQLTDVLAFRERRRQEQLDAIAATSMSLLEADLSDHLDDAKKARREVAQRRRDRVAASRQSSQLQD